MKVIMTSSIGGSIKENGNRIPTQLLGYNGLLEKLQREWVNQAKVLIIAGSPTYFEKNDALCECFKRSFPMSGLSISYMAICDERNESLLEKISEMDVVLLAGGACANTKCFFCKNRIERETGSF